MSQMQEGEQQKGIKAWLSVVGAIFLMVFEVVFLIFEPLIELTILGSYVVYSLSVLGFPGWFPERYKVLVLSVVPLVHPTVVGMSLLFAGCCLLITLSRLHLRSRRMFFFSLTNLAWLVCIGLAYAAISDLGLLSVMAQWLILLWYVALCIRLKKKPSAVARGAIEAPLPKNHMCSICHQASVSDPCLSCEGRYRSETQRVQAQNLRAKLAGVPATLTLKEWLNTLDNFHWHCAYCHGPFEVMEHYIPIPHGGTTVENCVPACHKCNLKKSNKHPDNVGKDK